MKKITIILTCILLALTTFAQTKPATAKPKTNTVQKPTIKPKERMVEVMTEYGNMIIKLYDSTPNHRDNFIKLVKEGFYDSLLFHRVISGFMIQGGDPESKNAPDLIMLGGGNAPGEMIPAEFKNFLIHKKGALAAARSDNPQKASSNCQFYIVEGQVYDDIVMNQMECNARNSNPAFTYTPAQRKIYETVGGSPFLDQNYTVFGEVVQGLDVIDRIAAVPKDGNDRPVKNAIMKMKMLN